MLNIPWSLVNIVDSIMVGVDAMSFIYLLTNKRMHNTPITHDIIKEIYSYKRLKKVLGIHEDKIIDPNGNKVIAELLASIGIWSIITCFMFLGCFGFYNPFSWYPHNIKQVVKSSVCIDESCCICMDDFSTNFVSEEPSLTTYNPDHKKVYITECGHCFHIKCLSEWCYRDISCPLCKKSLRDEVKFTIRNQT